MKSFLLSDWAPALARAARALAIVAAVLIVFTEFVYQAGMATGQAIHRLSDFLAGLASGRIDRAVTARAVVQWARATLDGPAVPVPAAPVPAPVPVPAAPVLAMPCAPVPPPAVGITPPAIDSLTVSQLRKLARARGLSKLARNGRRAELISTLTD